jgi:hypothetical protein
LVIKDVLYALTTAKKKLFTQNTITSHEAMVPGKQAVKRFKVISFTQNTITSHEPMVPGKQAVFFS